jgi:hypothetical protein
MAGEIQLNSTTFATESGGTVTVSNVDSATNRTNLGLGSIATQAADSVSISGGNITGGTIGSSVVFPAGHVIRTLTFESTTAVTNEVDQFVPIDSTNTSIQIPNYTYGNKLLIWAMIFVVVKEGSGKVECTGYYKTGGSLGSPATPSTGTFTSQGIIGRRLTSQNTLTTDDEDTLTMMDLIEISGSGTTNLDYAIYADFATAPSEIGSQKKRVFIQEIQG